MSLRNYEFGEGAVRMNKATNYLIKQARRAKHMWGLTDATIIECLERATYAEKQGKLLGNINTAHALDPDVNDTESDERLDK